MLTSLYYYQYYRPYLVKAPEAVRVKREKRTKENLPQEVALNKSLKNEVINYAKGIYKNTTDLKHTSKKLADDVSNYSKYKEFDEFDADIFERDFERNLGNFSGSYNKSVKFLRSQEHSPLLGEAADSLDKITDESRKILSVMGIDKNQDGTLDFSLEKNSFWNGVKTDRKVGAAKEFFNDINDKTRDILDNPMSQHMNFKSLNYYYNYKADKVQVDSFQIIKTGLLVNLAL